MGLLTSMILSATPKVGMTAPEFTVSDTDGKAHTLSQMLKHGPVLLVFFPKAFTGG